MPPGRRGIRIEAILDGYTKLSIAHSAVDEDRAAADHGRNTMLDGILNQWLQNQGRNTAISTVIVYPHLDLEPRHDLAGRGDDRSGQLRDRPRSRPGELDQ